MELDALLDLMRSKGVRSFTCSDVTGYSNVHVEFGELPFTVVPRITVSSEAERAALERELAEEAARPKDALALAMTAGDDHGGDE